MSKKIKITEQQLQTLMERRHSYKEKEDDEIALTQIEDKDENDIEVEEPEEVNESIEKIKSDFRRFL